MRQDFPFLGFGVGLRTVHYPHILEHWPTIDWFEVISENFMIPGGRPRQILRRVRERYPVVMHGVSLSIGSTDPLDRAYLTRLKELAAEVEPAWISDHLCWSSTGRHSVHDLLPIPQTEEALHHVASRVQQVQDFLGRRILLENVSTYLEYTDAQMTEWEFLSTLAQEADCMLLVDVNNIFVSSVNHGFDANTYIDAIPPERVGQFHLAGHSDMGTHLLDTHDHAVPDAVWNLYERAVRRFGAVSTLVEWDDHIPPFEELYDEVERAKKRYYYVESPISTGDDAAVAVAADQRA